MAEKREFDDLPIVSEFGSSLRAAMVAAEREEAQAQPAKRRRWWRKFPPLGTIFVLGAVGTAATAGTLTILRGSPIPAPKAADVQPVMTPRAATQRVLGVRAPDPSGTLPAFALRTGTSLGGQTCVTVGEERGGTFGLVGTDRTFRALPPTIVDGCGSITGRDAAVAGARILDADAYDDVRTVIYAVGGAKLRSAYLVEDGAKHRLVVRDGAVIAGVKGYPEDHELDLVLGFQGQRSVKHRFGGGPGTAADPDGPAWQALEIGHPVSVTKVGSSCVAVTPVRSIGPSTPTTSPICEPPASQVVGRSVDPWFFDIRTFHPGDHGGTDADEDRWSWYRAPARTIVWGDVDATVRRITVTAPGQRPTVPRPSQAGAFAAVFPASVAASSVRVTLLLKDGTTKTFDGPAGAHRSTKP